MAFPAVEGQVPGMDYNDHDRPAIGLELRLIRPGTCDVGVDVDFPG